MPLSATSPTTKYIIGLSGLAAIAGYTYHRQRQQRFFHPTPTPPKPPTNSNMAVTTPFQV
jgi:hypothetical protein